MRIFWELATRLIDIKGFIDDEWKGTRLIYNRPILGLFDVTEDEEAIIVVSEGAIVLNDENIHLEKKFVKYSQLLSIDKELFNRNVYLFGNGEGAKRYRKILHKNGIDVCGYCVSNNYQNNISDEALCIYNDDKYTESDAIVVAVLRTDYLNDIIDELRGCRADVYIEAFFDVAAIAGGNIATVIDKTLTENRNLVLCGSDDLFADLIESALDKYNIRLSHKIFSEFVFDILSFDPEATSVIVSEKNGEIRSFILEQLYSFGYHFEKLNLTGIQNYMKSKEVQTGKSCYVTDTLVGYSMRYSKSEPIMWKIFGDKKTHNRIIILGGSTSAEGVFAIESWGHKLHRKLINKGYSVQTFIGAQEGYDVLSEYLSLLRDGIYIKPSIVISMSSVNNVMAFSNNRTNLKCMVDRIINEGINKFDYYSGFPVDESGYSFWIRLERLIKYFVENELDAKYYGFAQPMNMYMDKMSLEDKIFFQIDENTEGAKSFAIESRDDDFYINLNSLFLHKNNMYYDHCHYSDEGNEWLSNEVMNHMIKDNILK